MGKFIGYSLMCLAGLCVLDLFAELIALRESGYMRTLFGQIAARYLIAIYVGIVASLLLTAWFAFTMEEIRERQERIIDILEGRRIEPGSRRQEPPVMAPKKTIKILAET